MKNSMTAKCPYRKSLILKNIEWYLYEAKSFIERGKKGYAKTDLCDFDYYLTQVLAYGLKDFAQNNWGTPMRFTDEEWDAYLNEMAKHFYNSMEENKDEVMPNKYHKYFVMCSLRCKSRHPIMQKYWEEEDRIAAWQNEERKKGFEMLVEVFDSLWY